MRRTGHSVRYSRQIRTEGTELSPDGVRIEPGPPLCGTLTGSCQGENHSATSPPGAVKFALPAASGSDYNSLGAGSSYRPGLNLEKSAACVRPFLAMRLKVDAKCGNWQSKWWKWWWGSILGHLELNMFYFESKNRSTDDNRRTVFAERQPVNLYKHAQNLRD